MGQYGFLVPDSYVHEVPGEVDMNTASILWGFSLGVAVFSVAKALKQSWKVWKRCRRVTSYVAMIWAVWLSSMVLGCLAWGFQRQYIVPSFGFYFSVALFWALQVQFLLQIILNRLGLLMIVPGQAARLKWVVFAIILAVNISVFVIWMPARLQISDRWIWLNNIWDRCEKVIFALVDGALNAYFIYLVRSRLIENGLTKYIPLYRMNLLLIFISLSLDVVLVGLMSLPSTLVYLSFHPVCYLLKLQIEMKMAELISKIIRSSGTTGKEIYAPLSSANPAKVMATNTITKPSSTYSGVFGALHGNVTTLVEAGDRDSSFEMELSRRGSRSTDPPLTSDDPTLGYKLFHVMLRIRDPVKSLHFYIDLMGMRTVFTMDTGPFTIYYLGYPRTDEHRADLGKFGRDTLAQLAYTPGLIELYHVRGSENEPEGYYSTGNQPPNLGLGHIGFSVPDVPLAVERLRNHGVEVLKELGAVSREDVPLSQWEAEKKIGLGDLHPAYQHVFGQIAFVKDPDGYTVELVPQKLRE
ncbi:lactoylglutathione lyase [Fusarium pseudoanthophilum]|uniref:Lactoylglutathione lyase n=1 Tax=Fusarium pseudoanthophilum TaxID=48495 RepID=A0A8H5NTK3_9HYPO|nr:lactoylglutathione lyase [Fusarium pseudoanthophilum]